MLQSKNKKIESLMTENKNQEKKLIISIKRFTPNMKTTSIKLENMFQFFLT